MGPFFCTYDKKNDFEGLVSVRFLYIKRPIILESHMYKVTKIECTLRTFSVDWLKSSNLILSFFQTSCVFVQELPYVRLKEFLKFLW